MSDLTFSRHALKRWSERFPNLNPDTEWYLSRRVGKRIKKRIKDHCQSVKMTGRQYRGLFYTISPGGVIFVIGGKDNLVVTVLPLHEMQATA